MHLYEKTTVIYSLQYVLVLWFQKACYSREFDTPFDYVENRQLAHKDPMMPDHNAKRVIWRQKNVRRAPGR